MGNGWIALHRQLQENPIWTCNEPFDSRSAWIDMLLSANHDDKEIFLNGHFRTIFRGQFHTSQLKLADRWHWKRDKVENYLKELKKSKMIDFTSCKSGETRGTTITIVNYSVFQNIAATIPASKGTSKPQQDGQQNNINSDINNNVNNDNNINNKREENPLPPVPVTRYPAGRYQNVFLSAEEASKLQKEFPSEADPMIEKLSEYMKQNYTKYRNDAHYEIIRKWILEDRNKPKAAEPKKNKALEYDQRHYTESQISAIERKKLGLI